MEARLPHNSKGRARPRNACGYSGGVAITFSRALKWYISTNSIEPMTGQFYSAAISVLARFSSGVSAYSCSRHIAWPYFCIALRFDAINIETEHPMWVYVRHNRSTKPWDFHLAGIGRFGAPISSSRRLWNRRPRKVDIWRSGYASKAELAHSGRAAQDQFDLVFRLTALNRQIELLESQLAAAPSHELMSQSTALELILDRQRLPPDLALGNTLFGRPE